MTPILYEYNKFVTLSMSMAISMFYRIFSIFDAKTYIIEIVIYISFNVVKLVALLI